MGATPVIITVTTITTTAITAITTICSHLLMKRENPDPRSKTAPPARFSGNYCRGRCPGALAPPPLPHPPRWFGIGFMMANGRAHCVARVAEARATARNKRYGRKRKGSWQVGWRKKHGSWRERRARRGARGDQQEAKAKIKSKRPNGSGGACVANKSRLE